MKCCTRSCSSAVQAAGSVIVLSRIMGSHNFFKNFENLFSVPDMNSSCFVESMVSYVT